MTLSRTMLLGLSATLTLGLSAAKADSLGSMQPQVLPGIGGASSTSGAPVVGGIPEQAHAPGNHPGAGVRRNGVRYVVRRWNRPIDARR